MSSPLSRLIRPTVLVLFIAGVLLLGAGSQTWATPAQGPFGQTVPTFTPTATPETITGGGGGEDDGDGGDGIPVATLQIVTPVAGTGIAPTATITPTGTMIPPATVVPTTPVIEVVTPTVPVPATLPVTGAPTTPAYVPLAWSIVLLLLVGLALLWNARRHTPS
jgi:hypothetical protein